MKQLSEILNDLNLGELSSFLHPVVTVSLEFNTIEIILEDASCYSEWIKGEGREICIFRAMDDNRVIGAKLPLKIWNGKVIVNIIKDNEKI